MRNISFCFQMHAPYRLKRYRFFDIGQDHYYYDDMQTEDQISWLAQNSYMPLLGTVREMVSLSRGKFHCGVAVSGITLQLCQQFAPEVIDVMKELAATKAVEFVCVPYSHSLAYEYDMDEFVLQLKMSAQIIEEVLGQKPVTVWNTDLAYSDEIADTIHKLGFKVAMTEGAKHLLSWKSPNYVYQSAASKSVKLLLRNASLSDELSFHFSDPTWYNFPMDAEKYANQLKAIEGEEPIVNIWVGADTFGIRQNAGTGIFDFLKALPYYVIEREMGFMTPSEAAKKLTAGEAIPCPYPTTWCGEGKDLSAFNGNDLQQEALNKLYAVAERVRLCKDKSLKRDWLALQSADHFQFMNHIDAGHTNYESAYDAFINYMNILSDFLLRVDEQYPTTIENEELNELLKTINNQEKEIAELEKQLKAAKKAPKAEVKAEPAKKAPAKKAPAKKTAAKK
ncbi:MAG: glycoside hydrolase family 57 protein [Bacteroidales bacterium]|nr:glycoside hydrolase family 57 protein [Candidatus Colicola faecequi]